MQRPANLNLEHLELGIAVFYGLPNCHSRIREFKHRNAEIVHSQRSLQLTLNIPRVSRSENGLAKSFCQLISFVGFKLKQKIYKVILFLHAHEFSTGSANSDDLIFIKRHLSRFMRYYLMDL